ncbi:General control protein [Recurvomyces mirabilis]|nr:General control protein [Recurvomyces mirabilis]
MVKEKRNIKSLKSPTIPTHILPSPQLFELPLADPQVHRLQDTALAITPQSFTTASQQQTWLPPPTSAGHPPQPAFTDFSLFSAPPPAPTQAHQATPRRAPSLDPTLQASFNSLDAGAYIAQGNNYNHSAQTNSNYTTQRITNRPARPPVPLFHSNSTGSLVSQPDFPLFDNNDITMGGGGNNTQSSPRTEMHLTSSPVNVAYEGTFGDLSAGNNMFTGAGEFNFDDCVEVGNHDNMPAADFTAINHGTISPKDVFNDSVPPSTTFTNLTTPQSGYLDTPDDDYETSPLFTDSLGIDNSAQWPSLFPEYDPAALAGAPLMTRNSSSTSTGQIVVHPGGESFSRKRSSTQASPASFSPALKHSAVAGVAARKRDKPLPPIMASEDDPVALKRARNTAAARKSRAKKVLERDDLEAEIADLQAQVAFWKAQALGSDNVTDSQ